LQKSAAKRKRYGWIGKSSQLHFFTVFFEKRIAKSVCGTNKRCHFTLEMIAENALSQQSFAIISVKDSSECM